MSVNDELGTRMKTFYEAVPDTKLVKRMPVAIRIDGKAFHTFTRGFKRPFDEVLIKTMQQTTQYLCQNIQGCVLGYTQSDEITLILVDYQTLTTEAWFDYRVEKLCSIAASMATMAFNKIFKENVETFEINNIKVIKYMEDEKKNKTINLIDTYYKAIEKGAMFDARCFNIPKEEVTNLIYWRQLDASRNSVQMVGQAYFSQKELQNKSSNDIQDMLMTQKGINWNDFPTVYKRGTAVIKDGSLYTGSSLEDGWHEGWKIDTEMPILKGEDRAYVDDLVYIGE